MSHPFEIRRSVALPVDPEQVWQAVATADGHASWFMAVPAEAWPEPEIADPPRHLRLPAGNAQMIEFLIEADAGGTAVLRFVHSGVLDEPEGGWPTGFDPAEFDAMNGAGWDMYLHTLAAHLRFFRGRPAVYAEAEAPGPGAWPAVVAALGAPAAPGVAVELAWAGGSLTSEVDYVAERFLGLRTDGGLIRFHDRSAIGLPVAVSHHNHTGADPGELTAAWRTWLAERATGTADFEEAQR